MIHSIAGQLAGGRLSDRRPFRAPHHSATMAALVGGGLRARPGEASLAHHGVLFLDEFPEFAPQVLDALLAPLSAHPRVRHARRQGMIWAWDITTSLPDFARRYQGHALALGLVLRPIGKTLYFMPPYVLDDEAMQHLAHGALAALEATLAEEMT